MGLKSPCSRSTRSIRYSRRNERRTLRYIKRIGRSREKQVVLCPTHLSNEEAAAFPLAGLTAYRALFTKGQIKEGSKLLITGIGGGVALAALLLSVAAGAEVYVTSSSEKKIARAKELGAKDGILYTIPNWSRELKKTSGELDVVLDSAGGDICTHAVPLLKQGGTIVTYGMTLGPKTPFTMQAVLKVIRNRNTS